MSDNGKDVDQVLVERGQRYGDFFEHAELAMGFKDWAHSSNSWDSLEADQRQAIDCILDKIARALTGDPNYTDNWRDIAGYATLVLRRLEEEQ